MLSDPHPKPQTHEEIPSPAPPSSEPEPEYERFEVLSDTAEEECRREKERRPATPLLNWKLEVADLCSESVSEADKGSGRKESARKLAARIWLVNGGFGSELGDSAKVLNQSMERATKWDPGFNSHSNVLKYQQVANTSDFSSLRSELDDARARIAELEIERQSTKKNLDHFLRKLAEEKESWRRREHEKIRAVVDSIKDDLHREKKTRQRMEMTNSKLANKLAESKLSAKRLLQDYEKERKTRVLMEEVCDELTKEIGDDKAEVEALKADSARIREEVEEERKMLQMAEVWREERVQMKLVDAKVTLEEKYSQLSILQSEIEAFLSARSDKKEEAEFLKEAADWVKAQEIKEFYYQPPPASEDIFSVFEELQPKEEIKACHVEEQCSSNSIEGSDPSVNASASEMSEVCSVGTRRSRKKGSSIARFWRSSQRNNGVEYENGRMHNATLSPDGRSGEVGLSSPSVGNCSPVDSVKPRMNEGMKGFVEWPRGMQKHSLKAKLVEARIDGNKIQLRQALKQKM